MRLQSKVLLAALAAAYPVAHASDAAGVNTGGPSTALVNDNQGKPVHASSGECWHSSLAAPSAAMAPGCRAPGSQSLAPSAAATSGSSAMNPTQPAASSEATAPAAAVAGTGASASQSDAAGGSKSASSPAYVTDSRGQVVRGSSGDCWRTGTWTPAQATVVGCDGVMARALPVPAAAEPGKANAAPSGAPAEKAPPSVVSPSQAGPELVAPSTSRKPGAGAAPIAPVVPAPAETPPATLGPDTGANAAREPASEKVTFDTDTFFDFDKSTLKPEGRRKLDTLASKLANTTVEVVVAVGHTDSIGTQAYNQGLSERRARAVASYLLDKGVSKEKIFTEGKGETQPVASNASKQGRAKNRRVEVEVVSIRSKK